MSVAIKNNNVNAALNLSQKFELKYQMALAKVKSFIVSWQEKAPSDVKFPLNLLISHPRGFININFESEKAAVIERRETFSFTEQRVNFNEDKGLIVSEPKKIDVK